MSIEIAIVIVNYRTPGLTLDCLRSLEPEVDSKIRVVVVDNASGDGSADEIETAIAKLGFAGWVSVLRSPINGGFAAGNNLGIRSIDASAYLLLNSDTIVQPGAIAGLREAMRTRPDAGIIGPGLLNVQGKHDASVFRAPLPAAEFTRAARSGIVERLLPHLTPSYPPADQPFEAEWLGFACVLVRTEVIDQVGGLDEGYFMYFEDADYCRAARDAGFRVRHFPQARVVHLRGGSSDVKAQQARRKRPPRYYYEARARYFRKHYGVTGAVLVNVMWTAGRGIHLTRERLFRAAPRSCEREWIDNWIGVFGFSRGDS